MNTHNICVLRLTDRERKNLRDWKKASSTTSGTIRSVLYFYWKKSRISFCNLTSENLDFPCLLICRDVTFCITGWMLNHTVSPCLDFLILQEFSCFQRNKKSETIIWYILGQCFEIKLPFYTLLYEWWQTLDLIFLYWDRFLVIERIHQNSEHRNYQ